MKEIIKIKSINLGKLNNAEYANFASRFIMLIPSLELESYGLDSEDYMRYLDLQNSLNDLVAHSRVSDETAELQALDKERDAIGVHLLNIVRTERTSPIAERAKAAQSLYNVLKPYTGFQKLPNQQETVTISGMLTDLQKEGNTMNMQTLGISPLRDALSQANARYASLTEQRTTNREASKVDNSKIIRTEMDDLYDYMTTMIFVQSVAAPTEGTATFITTLNAIIDEVNVAYNQRMAQSKAKAEKEESTEAVE